MREVVVDAVEHRRNESCDGRAGCACGWTAASSATLQESVRRWELHLRWSRAAEATERARALHGEACERCAELRVQWAAARVRRGELRRLRMALRAQMEGRRGTLAGRAGPSAALLERARILAGQSVEELWIDYFALGGNASLDELTCILAGREQLDPGDHDLLAVALNERFEAFGFGSPLSYWGQR